MYGVQVELHPGMRRAKTGTATFRPRNTRAENTSPAFVICPSLFLFLFVRFSPHTNPDRRGVHQRAVIPTFPQLVVAILPLARLSPKIRKRPGEQTV